MLKADDPLNHMLDRIRAETGNDDWRDRARAVLKIACAMADDWVPGDERWYEWMQEQIDAIYGEIENPGGGQSKE